MENRNKKQLFESIKTGAREVQEYFEPDYSEELHDGDLSDADIDAAMGAEVTEFFRKQPDPSNAELAAAPVARQLTSLEARFPGYRVTLHASKSLALLWDITIETPSGQYLSHEELPSHDLDAMYAAIFEEIDRLWAVEADQVA